MPSPAPIRPSLERRGRPLLVGITLIAAVGFALSYDALRQMAVAAHIRGPLTYLFPLVIDGFIALGVTTLLVLRTAPLRSRLYVWALVTLATGASVWANALHAIRLNEQARLHLSNATVGALSAIAPLALAGAVHLCLVINRHLTAGKAAAEPPTAKVPGAGTPLSAVETARPSPAQSTATPDPEPPATALTPRKQKSAPEPRERKGSAPGTYLLELARQMREETGAVRRTDLERAVRDQGYTVDRTRAQKAVDAALKETVTADKLTATA